MPAALLVPRLLITFIPDYWTDHDLVKLFQYFPGYLICNVVLSRDPRYAKCCNAGYGFADFSTDNDAEYAMAKLDGRHIENKTLRVVPWREPSEDTRDAKIIVRSIPASWTDGQVVWDHYSRGGSVKIVQVRLLNECHGIPCAPYAFILFHSHTDAVNAIDASRYPEGLDSHLGLQVALWRPSRRDTNETIYGPARFY